MLDVSVIICSRNPRPQYLSRSLESLRKQTLPTGRWELLLVDNGSREALSGNWNLSWHAMARHIREEAVGLTPARLRGIREAKGEMIIFVDDDNSLADDFLERAIELRGEYPYLGAFGAGMLSPEFEIELERELSGLVSLLALRLVDRPRWSNHVGDVHSIPWGAGMCVTREVAYEYLDLIEKLGSTGFIDRRAERLFCGGDDLFSWAACRVGRGFGLFPALRITHLIPKERLTKSYFLRLLRDKSTSAAILRYKLSGVEPEKITVTEMVHVLLHGLRNGVFSMCCRWVAAKGEEEAARIIEENQLMPLEA